MVDIEIVVKRFPEMILEGCLECPYRDIEYNDCSPDYIICRHPDGYRREIMDERHWDGKEIEFPDWCPLEDWNDDDVNRSVD